MIAPDIELKAGQRKHTELVSRFHCSPLVSLRSQLARQVLLRASGGALLGGDAVMGAMPPIASAAATGSAPSGACCCWAPPTRGTLGTGVKPTA